jgi:tRNA modification GTPase
LQQTTDTIAAIATGVARGGVGIVRISGVNLSNMTVALLGQTLVPRVATYLTFRDDEQEVLDQGLAIYFPAPHSYTGQDVLELHGHGGIVVLNLLLQRCLQLGARIAQPGEFTKRAYLNNKIDLIQAESIADLIDASSKQAVRSANRSLQGHFSTAIHHVLTALIGLRMAVEGSIDFPEDDLPLVALERHKQTCQAICTEVEFIIKQSLQGAILRNGAQVVLVGQPNVGKSSLLNCLTQDDVALVSEIPGTTRDINRQEINIEGVPFHLFDTAGLRDSKDVVELMGIEKTKQFIAKADVALFILEAEEFLPALDQQILAYLPAGVTKIIVVNKIDLMGQLPRLESDGPDFVVYVSAKTGEGIDLLRACLLKVMGWQSEANVFVARERHIESLRGAKVCLERALSQASQLELMAEELRLAQELMSQITGEYSSDDLLGDIFSHFCIGK